eukprot:gnl/TRDRNA2_/TRDRNA2_129823_c0_seq1.p1 gnl/TRDRNA2_/TRDRNA2_129823_c0~~gnl/TRDRNA2_/TRDRNA2_129823_c0_seq1.p1  ORF type:complete len:418 (+),score=26.77 gnl/TRDRNA2_/TRDRNA2_129823_c0_seq1:48-1256(+)
MWAGLGSLCSKCSPSSSAREAGPRLRAPAVASRTSEGDPLATSWRAPEKDSTEPHPYGDGASYWDARYQAVAQPVDWLASFAELQPIICELVQDDLSKDILNVGCGNGLLGEEMYDYGFRRIVNFDISSVVIEQMRARNVGRPGMTWDVMDATCTEYRDNSFDIVIDKSTIDTFATMDTGRALLMIVSFLKDAWRVLRPGGTLICISLGAPECREHLFKSFGVDFAVEIRELPVVPERRSMIHYVYICRRCEMSIPHMSAGSCTLEVTLHIYNLGRGGLSRVLNSAIPALGVYHTGVEVLGVEWFFGVTEGQSSTGVSCISPRSNPMHIYRKAISMGPTDLPWSEIHELLTKLQAKWLGCTYSVLTRNCTHFSDFFCRLLGCGPVPSWTYGVLRGARTPLPA